MEFVRPVDWEHPHVTLEGGYKGQYLYAGESCLIVATKVPPGVGRPAPPPAPERSDVLRGAG